MPQNRLRGSMPMPARILTRSIAALAATIVCTPAVQAAPLYWDGVTGTWGDVLNWSTDPNATTPDPAAVPGIADLVTFNITTVNGAETINLDAARSALGLVFNNTGTTALQGGVANQTLTLGASGILLNAGAGAVTIGSGTAGQNVAVTLGAAQAWTNNSTSLLTVTNGVTNAGNLLTVNGTGNTAIAGVIGAGAGGVTKAGTGILTLSATNTYTGITTVSGGTLRATVAGALGANTTATALTLAGGTVQLANNAATTFGRNTTVTANSVIVSDVATASAGVTHTLGTLSIGAQTLTISRGGLVNAGTAGVTFGATTLTGAATVSVDTGALLTLGAVTNAANTLTVTGAGNTAITGIIGAGAGGITKSGNGVLTLSGANTYTGNTTINAGTVRATVAGALGAGTAANSVTLAGGTLQLANDAATTFGRNTTVTANSTVESDRAAAGAGVAHTLGTLSIGAQTLNVTRGALATSGTGTVVFGATTLTGAATFAPAANAQLNLGAVSGGFGFTKDGAGIMALTAAGTFTGPVTVANGTLRVSNATALGTNATINVLPAPTAGGNGNVLDLTGTITVAAGKTLTLNSNGPSNFRSTLLNSANNNTWASSIVLAGDGLTQFSAASGTTLTITGAVTSTEAGTLFARGAGTVAFNGVLTLGPRNFSHTEGGTVVVNSTGNTWASSQVADGQIQLGANNALANVDFSFGQASGTNGRFELNGFNQTVAGLRTDTASTGTAHILRNSNRTTASTLNFTTAAATTDVLKNTHIQGIGSLTLVKNGSGRFELQDVRVENSGLIVNDGTLAFTGASNQVVRPNISGLAAGTIEKAGTGITTLLGTYNHAGATIVTSGRLNIGSGTAGSITVADGTTLGIGGTLTSGALTFGTAGATTFVPNLTAPGGAAVISPSALSVGGTATITPTGANIVPGTYTLIGYGGAGIGGAGFAGFSLGAAGTYPHMTASLVNNSGQNRVDLNVTAVDSLVWTGASATPGVWDINTTANFKLASDGSSATFFQGDRVLFDDAPVTKAITVTGTPTIGNLVFNNSTGAANDYTITGALTGPGGITKNGTGTATIATAGTFTGPISVTDGVLVLGGANLGTGDVTVSGGTLRLGNAEALTSATSVTITPGGTLDINGTTPGLKIREIHVSGAGVGGNGAIVNNGAGIANNNHAFTITFDGDTTWGGSGRYDVNNTLINGGNFTLTKRGTAELAYQPAAGSTLGNVIVEQGIFTSQTNNPLATTTNVTVNNGGTHQLFSAITVQHSATLNDGGILRSSNSTPIFAGQINLSGTTAGRNIQAATGTTLNVAGKITGTGGFTMNETGGTVQIRNANNDYAGDTVLTAGTLHFDAVGKLPVTTNVIINGGTFDPANRTHSVRSLSGTSGQINQGTAGTGVFSTTQSTATTFSGNVNRVTLQMDGTGSLSLEGTTDNSAGLGIVNNGTLILAKTGDYAVHTFGSGNLGVTVNGGTLRIGGSLTAFTGGSASNNPPADITPATPPANYVDQIFNFTEVQLNAGGTLDLNGRMEAIDGLAGGGTVTNSSATTGRLYVGYNNTTSTSAGFLGNTSTFSGVIQDGAGQMELRKIGTGTLVLSGASTHTGSTVVSGGTLQVTGSLGNTTVSVATGATLSGNGALGGVLVVDGTFAGGGNVVGGITANTGATLSVGGNTSGGTAAVISTPTLTMGAGTRTVNIDFTGSAADRINTTAVNGLTLDGTNNVTLLLGSSGWVTGSYPIYTYNPAGTVQGTGVASLIVANPVGHNTVSFSNDGVGNVNLNIIATTNKWVGTTAAWDINTTNNWSAADQKFLNGDNVVFDNTATTFAPTLATGVNPNPASVIFDNTTAYTLSGAGGITGSGRLTKRNTGTVTLSNPNTYTGNTVVEAGTLITNYNNGTATTVLNAASLVDIASEATLRAITNDADFTWANTVTGTGTLVIDAHATADAAARTVTMSGNLAAFTGTLDLTPTTGTNGFRLSVDNANDLGSATVNVGTNGQIFVTAASLTFPNNIAITGTGFAETAGRLGAIRAANPTTFTGAITVNTSAKIGALGGVVNVTNTISGGTLTFGGSNNNNAETFNLTGDASGLAGLIVNEGAATANANTILFNVGTGGTVGTLGNVPVTIRGDGFKTGVLRFDRSNGYTLGGAITAAGTTSRATLDLDVLGTGFDSNGLAINMGTPAAGGPTRVGVTRANAVATFSGTLSGSSLQIGVGANMTGAVVNLNAGTNASLNQIDVALGATNATLNIAQGATVAVGAGGFFVGQQSGFSGTVNQLGGDVTVGNRLQIGHWPNETSTYTMSAGNLTIANTNAATSPSGTGEQTGGIYVGIDGTAIMNQANGNVTTDWVVLDNRGDTGGVDQYNLAGGVLAVRMTHGIIQRNASAEFNFTGGTIRNVGSAVAMAIAAPLRIGTGGVGTPTLDTNGATNSIAVSQSMTGAGALAKTGAGTLNLNAASAAWTGNFDVTGGTVAVSVADGGLGSFTTAGRTISASNNSTLSFSINNVFGNGVGNANLPAISLQSGSTLTTTRYNAIGALTLNASTLTSVHGTADAANYQSWQLKGNVTVGGAAASAISGTGTFPGVHLDANTTFNVADATGSTASDLVVSVPLLDQSGDFAPAVGGLTKSGAGTMEITSAAIATYTGPTTISAGTLLLNGSISGSAVSITGGTLAGSGSTGNLLLDAGILAPSDVLDPLDTGALTFDGGTYALSFTGAGLNSQTSVTGSVAFTSNTALTLDFSTYDPVENVDSFTLVLNDGLDAIGLGGNAFTFAGNPLGEGATFTATSGAFTQQFKISYAGGSGNDVVLAAVPEPASAVLLLGGLASLAGMRRARRRS